MERISFLAALLSTRSSSVRIMIIEGLVWHAREKAHAEGWRDVEKQKRVLAYGRKISSESTHGAVATDRLQGYARG